MRGLLIKDIQLTLSNKKLILSVLFFGVMLIVLGNMDTFIVGYITLIFTMQVLTSISYDDYDKSNVFLFTLPISRRQYVMEKYIFGLLSMIIGWCLSVAVIEIKHVIIPASLEDVETGIATYVSILIVALLMAGFGIPIRLRFGNDNGRMVVMAIVVACVVAVFLGFKTLNRMGINVDLLEQNIMANGRILLAGFTVGIVVLYIISILISLRVVNNKEF